MKKLALIMCSFLAITSCSTRDEEIYSYSNNSSSSSNRDYYAMYSIVNIFFITNEGINIFDPQNPIVDEKDIDVDIYGVNGYEDEYPYSINTEYRFVDFLKDNTNSLVLFGYGNKSKEHQQALKERGWYKYKITFPDNTIYEVKVEGVLYNAGIDYYPEKVYVNDELKWERTTKFYTNYIPIAIVK